MGFDFNEDKYAPLKLENQLCFPLYAAAREVVKKYKPHLDKLDLTYTQYITMMLMWEYKEITSKELGNKLFLDSGTLTPLLKKLEGKKLVTRKRSETDERELIVKITAKGERLRDEALFVPQYVGECIPLTAEEAVQLYGLLYKILSN